MKQCFLCPGRLEWRKLNWDLLHLLSAWRQLYTICIDSKLSPGHQKILNKCHRSRYKIMKYLILGCLSKVYLDSVSILCCQCMPLQLGTKKFTMSWFGSFLTCLPGCGEHQYINLLDVKLKHRGLTVMWVPRDSYSEVPYNLN